MDQFRTKEGRIALIGLTVLMAATLLVFAFVFLGLGDTMSWITGTPGGGSTTDMTNDPFSTDWEQVSSMIADLQAQMNGYQAKLESPYLRLVNESNPLPETFEAPTLSDITAEDFSGKLESVAAQQFLLFLQEAASRGFKASVTAAYRSEAEQEKLYNSTVQSYMNAGYAAEKARSMAASEVGSVNCSEHQLGFAVDFSSKELASVGSDGTTTFGDFLLQTMPKYGFILSYPAGSESQTEHVSSYTHYRYVGSEAAEIISEKGWTLPQYRDYLKIQIDYQKQTIDSLQRK